MKTRTIVLGIVGVALVMALLSPVVIAGKGNGFPKGPHYELGLIGRPNNYTGGGTDNSHRHNIFIPLDTDGYVDGKVKIIITQGTEFLVIDGDATDEDGVGVAKLQIAPGYYAVFARALGKPGGNIDITAYFTYWEQYGVLSDAVWLGNVSLTRGIQKDGSWVGKKPQTKNISKLFYYTGDITIVEDGNDVTIHYTSEWVFDIPYLEEYWWDVVNNSLKRLEIRFYPVPPGYVPPQEYSPPEI
jgi:hypothetical protein